MFIKTKAIVLKALKYQEKSLIVTCYTQSHGVKSFFVPTAFSAKKNNQKIAYFQPLTLLEIEFNHKNKGTLEHFKEIKISEPYYTISTSIHKNAIVLFLSETLYHALNENTSNESLFEFLETSLLWLDHHDEVANFHIMLLLKITKFLGFFPDLSTNGTYFDLLNGSFSGYKNTHCTTESECILLKKALQTDFGNLSQILSGTERQMVLQIVLKYYQIHIENFKIPQSLSILKEVFA